MKSNSLIRKKYSFNNIQILSKYELQNKFDKVLLSIQPNEILSNLSFFNEISQYFDSSFPEKAFLTYKFTLFCSILIKNQEIKFFQKLFLKYSKIFIKSCHKYYSFAIIKIEINNIFKEIKKNISLNEYDNKINNLIEKYKSNTYDSIIELNINNFVKDENGVSFFFAFLDCLKFAFDKDQINGLANYLVTNSLSIIKKIIVDKSSKINYFKKLNNIIQFHIKEIGAIITNNNSKKKCTLYLTQFFISIITIYNEIIKLFELGIYDFYGNDFIIGYIQKNLITTIMQFLEKKYFIIDEKIIKKIIELSDNIETYLLNNPKINEKKYFIEYTWIMSQFFNFLYHSEDKTQSIIYGNKIINLYKNKLFISRTVVFIKLSLYEYYLKCQKGSLSQYDTNEHLNNISELIIMFGKCEIDGEHSEKYLIKMINHLFKILTEHIIYIINNRPLQVENIYYLLISLNPFLIKCKKDSNNKNILKKVNLFNIFCSITKIISSNKNDNKNNDKKNNQNSIFYFIEDKSLSKEEKNLFLDIISVFIVFDENCYLKIFELLNDLYNFDETKYFLQIYFNIIYQLEKLEKYNSLLLFDLLNLLYNFFNLKFKQNKIDKEIISNLKNNYFQIYTVYSYNVIKYSYRKILKKDKDNDIDSKGILTKISNSIKILIKFIEGHNKIIELFSKIIKIDTYNNKSIFYLCYNIIITYFLDLIESSNEVSSKNISFIYQQIYLIATEENIFSPLPVYIQNFIYYILYRLIHNVNTIINNRDLFLIKGNNNISKTIKSIIYNNITIIKEERKKIKKNDSFFNLEPLMSFSIDKHFSNNELNNNEESYNLFKNNEFFFSKESSINQYINFKINFILDTNNIIEIIKLYYLTGNQIDIKYLENYFDYYIPILNKEKDFSDNFSLILNIFYLLKRILSIKKTNQNEKINFDLFIDILKNNEKNLTFKKNIIIRLLTKYIYISNDKNNHINKINDLLICLTNELKKMKKDQILNESDQKNQKYLTYIELLSLQFFIQIFNNYLSDNNIDELLHEGINLLIKCLELCKAFLNEKYIIQYLPNEKCRLKAINDFLFEEINEVDLIYLLNMDDYEFIFLQLLDKIFILTDFIFKKMLSFGYGDNIIEIFHKLRNFTILKYNKKFYQNFLIYLIKILRKWKRKETFDISIDICDFKTDSEYTIFISKLYYNYILEKYPKFLINNKNNDYKNFNIFDFVKINKLEDDPLLNKCLELNNINQDFNIKEKSIYFKNIIKSLKKENVFSNNQNLNDLKDLFLKTFHIENARAFYFGKFVDFEYKYINKIILILFENEIINNITFNEKSIDLVIKIIKSKIGPDKLKSWKYYKYIKYYKKNIKNLIYISSYSQLHEITLKLINFYISSFHNFKYNLSYKGNENNNNSINEDDNLNDNIDYLERINISDDNKDKINENKHEIINNEFDNKFNSISNLISIFRIRNYFYIYIKMKDKSVYDIIDIQIQKEFEILFNYMRNIAAKENSEKKLKKREKNEEYRKALFNLQKLFFKFCPNFMNLIKQYYSSHINFNNYINSKIKKHSLKITSNDVINWLFQNYNEQISNKNNSHFNKTNKRYKLMSIDEYKKKFIFKIFHSSKFKFSFYENDINDLFYYIPSIELSKIPLENIPLLYNLTIIRTLNINFIKLNPIKINISITKDIFCLLNPKKDLVDTEKKILPTIQKYKINCINSREPTEKEMKSILDNKLMYIYCGHGDSLKYLKKEYLESHKISFLTFLFGCNSANSRLLTEKDTQPLSTPQLFLKQLCPFFFGFLWPVSSQDLDDLTVELLEILFKNKEPVSLVKIIILLKRKFNLRWFNGAALVMYCNCDINPKFI